MHCCNKIKHLVKKISYRDENTAKYQYFFIFKYMLSTDNSG